MKFLTDIRVYLFLSLLIQLVFFRFNTERFYHYWEMILAKKRFYYSFLSIIFLYFLVFKLLSWFALEPSGADFSHFDYAMWNGAWTGKLDVSIDDNNYYLNLLGNHFAPFLYLFAPLYWIYSSHFIPQALQVVALAFTFFVAKRVSHYFLDEIKSPYSHTQSFFLALGLIFNEMTLRVFKFEFHHEIFYIPLLLLLCLYCYQYFDRNSKKLLPIILTTFLVCSIKEDAPLVIIGIFFFYAFKSKRHKLAAITLFLSCSIYFLLSIKFFMPFFQKYEASSYLGLWSKYGTNVIDIARNMLMAPHQVFLDILSAKGFYKLLIPFFFLPLAGFYSIILLGGFVIHLASDSSMLNSLSLYYASPLLPLVFFTFMLTLKKLKDQIRTITILLFFAFSLINAFGSLRIKSPTQTDFNNRSKAYELVQAIPAVSTDVIFISGKLLAQTPYRQDLRRIWDIKEIERNDIQAFLIYTKDQDFPFSKEGIAGYTKKVKQLPNMEVTYEDSALTLVQRKK